MSRVIRKIRAFSLVELVIVVVIIGVIAAIAVPRISRGAKGAGESALRGDLASLRNSIDMYAAEHSGTMPGSNLKTETELIAQLTKKTDAAGNVGAVAGTHIYGPYLRRGFPPVPVGPNIGATGVIMTAVAPVPAEATATAGWVYDYVTGDLIVNTDDIDEKTTAYSSY